MRSKIQFSVVDAHSAGAPARVVTGGVAVPPGRTIAERRTHLKNNRDDVRKLLMYEPRGSSEMCGSILMPPCDPAADVGIVFIESGGWPEMCGAGTIGAATVILETGMLPVCEPVTTIVFDTPAGRVVASVDVRGGAVQGISIRNVPSFMAVPDVALKVPEVGEVIVDIAYGGNFYALVPASRFGLRIVPEHADRLVAAGRLVRDAANKSVTVRHPLEAQPSSIPMVILTEDAGPGGAFRNLVFFGGSGVDRSPGGTGTSARMAQRYFRGEQKLGEVFLHDSIIGSRFEGRLVETQMLGDVEAVIPTIRGRAHITGLSTFVLDPEDPFPEGFGVGYGSDARPRAPSPRPCAVEAR